MVNNILISLGFNVVWIAQGVNKKAFQIYTRKGYEIHLYTTLIKDLDSNRANSHKFYSLLNFQPYLHQVNIDKYRYAFKNGLRMSSHRL